MMMCLNQLLFTGKETTRLPFKLRGLQLYILEVLTQSSAVQLWQHVSATLEKGADMMRLSFRLQAEPWFYFEDGSRARASG